MSFAPGHISLTFAIHDHADPLKMGSTGLGIVLPKGVYCSVVDEKNEGDSNSVIIGNEIVEDPVVLRAVELLGYGNKGLSIFLRRDLKDSYLSLKAAFESGNRGTNPTAQLQKTG